MSELPIAYDGKEPYIFVSYAHADIEKVVPVINALQKWGFRVWYDAGIEAGTEWPAYIGEHIKKANCVLIFMSEAAIASPHCRREITLAESKNKKMLTVYFKEGLELPDGLDLQLCITQAMFMSRFSSVDSFAERLIRSEILRPSCAYPDKLPGKEQSFFEPPAAPKKSSGGLADWGEDESDHKPISPVRTAPAVERKQTPVYTPSPKTESKIYSTPSYSKTSYSPAQKSIGKKFDIKKIGICFAVAFALAIIVTVINAFNGAFSPGGNDNGGDIGGNGGNGGENSIVIPDNKKEEKYYEALSLISSGSYYDAYVILEALGDYSDSASKLAEIKEQALLQNIYLANIGDKVLWGAYEQDNNKKNGKEPIEWIVLQQEEGRVLLLSSKSLDSRQYHKSEQEVSWETCDLRSWLINTFYNSAFSDKEKFYMALVEIETFDSNNTKDEVFLLSEDELNTFKRLYPNMDLTSVEQTQYAISQGAGSHVLGGWWLRGAWKSFGYPVANYAFVCRAASGMTSDIAHGIKVNEVGLDIRPCVWVDISSVS